MKVSIITATYNSQSTIKDTIDSVLQQTYYNIEYIVIDGASTDKTIEIVKSYGNAITKFVSEPDKGLYDAINKGIAHATGDIVGILNSDDFFASPNIVSTIVRAFEQSNVDAVYADVAYVKAENTSKVVRWYSSKKFSVQKLARGYMPAHPSFYAKRELYLRFGLYKIDYKIAADFEMMIRLFHTNNIRYKYLPMLFVYMRMGGVSNRNFYNIYLLNKETLRACRENNLNTSMLVLLLKYFNKIFEYFNPRKKAQLSNQLDKM